MLSLIYRFYYCIKIKRLEVRLGIESLTKCIKKKA